MERELLERLRAVSWAGYRTAYGSAAFDHTFERANGATERWGSVPEQLELLRSSDEAVAVSASHHLWCCLCHQHAYVASAALPALPFLLATLDHASERVVVETLDILVRMASCSRAENAASAVPPGAWAEDLRRQLVVARPRFEALAASPSEEVAGWARTLVAELVT